MNSLKNIGNYHDKNLYYDLEKKEFYALNLELSDPDVEILNLDDNSDLAKEIKEGKITNEAELIALNLAYKANIEYQIKQDELFKNIEKLKKKGKLEEKRKLKRTYRSMIIGSLLLTLLAFNKEVASYGNLLKANMKDLIDDYRDNHENDDKHLSLFLKSINENDTISPQVKNLLELNFGYLVDSDIYIPDHEVSRMCKRIKNFDFTSTDEENFDEVLPYLLFGESNTLTNLIARQLLEVSSSKEPSMESILFGELVSINNTEILESIFIHDANAFVKVLASYYKTDEKRINAILSLIGEYSNTFLIEEKETIEDEFHSYLRSLIINNKKGKKIENDLEKYILSSQIFDGEYIFINNIFADTSKVMVNDETYGPYNLYFNTDTGYNLSIAIYYQKLVDIIKNKGNNLDYNDPDCRFLIYLINLAHMDSWDFDKEDLSSCETPDDLALKIINNNFMPYGGRVDVNPKFIYAYLTSGYLRLDDALNQMRTPSNNAFSVSLFLELYRCLTIEEQAGNISYDDYNEQISGILDKIRENNPSIYEILMKSIEEENPLLDDLNLYPFTYEFKGEDIKKYIYEPEKK